MVSDGTESTSKRLYMDNGLVYDNTNNELKLSSIQIDDYIYHKGDTDTYFGFDAADHFRIVEGGGTRFQVDSNGRIGIGTTAPGTALDVNGTVTATSFTGIQVDDVPTLNQDTTGNASSATNADNVKIDDALSDTTNYLVFTGDSTAGHKRLYEETNLRWDSTNNRLYVIGDIRVSSGLIHDGDTNTQFRFPANDTAAIRTNGTDRVYVNSSGDVGINTDTPLGKLHVNGGTGDCVVVIQADTNNSGESDNPTLLFIQDGTFRTSEIGNDTNNGMVYRSYGDQIWYSSSVHSSTSNTALKDNQTERMRLTNSGNVGIGTDSPGQKLEVNGNIKSSGVLDISKDGEVAKFQPATSGSHTLVNFNSKVNSGSDKGFILVQDESANSPGTGGEDLRMTVGVFNDFKQSSSHSDELWLQGGGRLCYNVGSWDSELNTIIGTPGSDVHGALKHEWRINNGVKMTLNNSGYTLDVAGAVKATGFMNTSGVYQVGQGNAVVVKHSGIWTMDDYTWRRLVPQRWSGYIVFTPVANDHSAFAIRAVNNSNAGAGSRDWRVQTDYYDSNQYISSRYNGGWLEFRKHGTTATGNSAHYYHVTIYGAII